MAISRERAETVGVLAVAWLAGNDELVAVFQGATGAGEAEFRAGLSDAAFQASVLDFLVMDDAWIVAFCDANQLPYDLPMMARAMLPGGEQVHWT